MYIVENIFFVSIFILNTNLYINLAFYRIEFKMNDVFIGNHVYTFIYYVSLFFGTWMTIIPKTHKVIGCTISLLWCLTIVGNQIDYVMKPWIMEDTEKTKQDMAFEKILHLDFWTYNAICLLSCLFPLISRKIEVTTALPPPETSTNTWRVIIVFVLVIGNIVPACFSYNFPGIQKKAGSAYNLLFQDFCKLGILTVDLQFAWFCWSLEDGFLRLNNVLQQMTVSSDIPTTTAAKSQGRATITARNNYYHRYDVYRVEVAYGKLMHDATLVCSVCEERVLINTSCYMFNTICGLFDTISAYRTRGAPLLLAIVHLSWVVNCAGRIALVCFAASSVVDQDDRLHDLAQIARETLDVNGDCWEMKRLSRRLRHSKVKFDVCGMVTVDKTLLSSAVISVISYLVIVLQYNYS